MENQHANAFMQMSQYLHNALRQEYANEHIIYERLHLPPSVPITYKEPPTHFSPPIQTGTTCTTETRPTPNTHAHKTGCWPGYCGWVGNLSGRLMRKKEAGKGRRRGYWGNV